MEQQRLVEQGLLINGSKSSHEFSVPLHRFVLPLLEIAKRRLFSFVFTKDNRGPADPVKPYCVAAMPAEWAAPSTKVYHLSLTSVVK